MNEWKSHTVNVRVILCTRIFDDRGKPIVLYAWVGEMSHVFRQDYVRGPFRNVRVPLGRRRRHRVRLSSVMELVVLVLDPVEFEKVDGQQDDAQQQHEADGQRHGKPSKPHPNHRSSRRKSENSSESSGESNVTRTHHSTHTSVTSHSRNGYVSTAYLLTAVPRGPEKVGRRPTTRRPRSSFHSRPLQVIHYIRIYIYINIIILSSRVCAGYSYSECSASC